MRKRQRLILSDDTAENFWPSFTDLISTVALILFVLVLLAYMQNLISVKNLEAVRAELGNTTSRLGDSQRQIGDSEKRLRSLESELRRTQAEIDVGQARLKQSEEQIAQQTEVIGQSNRELGGLRSRLQGIAVLRLDVLQKVKQAIETQLSASRSSGAPLVLISENGNIVINERLLFEYNSHSIKHEAKPLLDTLSNALANVLGEASVRDNIDVVLIQGHTDTRGSAAYNRQLSAQRADAVLDYIFGANKRLEQTYGAYFASSAYSEFRPISPGDDEAAHEQNRRIEISLVLKDSGIRSVIDDYMQNLDPTLRPPATPR